MPNEVLPQFVAWAAAAGHFCFHEFCPGKTAILNMKLHYYFKNTIEGQGVALMCSLLLYFVSDMHAKLFIFSW